MVLVLVVEPSKVTEVWAAVACKSGELFRSRRCEILGRSCRWWRKGGSATCPPVEFFQGLVGEWDGR